MTAPLRCEGLALHFGGVAALDDVTLDFPEAGAVAIIGPNGAGKTTLLDVLTGFQRADRGRCFVGTVETTRLAPHLVARAGISRTFQDLRLVNRLSALDNAMLARPAQREERIWTRLAGLLPGLGAEAEERRNRERCEEILEFVGLAEKMQTQAGDLSYGQQKLLSLGCALATEHRILFLDEPVAGVHPELIDRIVTLIGELDDEGRLIVFIEHDLMVVRRAAKRLIVLDNGRVVADGEPIEVLKRPEIMAAYVG